MIPARVPFLVLAALGVGACAAEATSRGAAPSAPETRTDDVVDVVHGVRVADPYRWLEDQEAPATREWLAEQNAYTDAVLGSLPGRAELRELATRLLRIDSVGVPVERGGRYFYRRQAADQDLAVLYWREGPDGAERVLVDPHGMSADHSVNVSLMDVSRDGRKVAYGVRQGGVDEVELHVLEVDSGRDVAELPADLYIATAFAPDGEGLYYSCYGTAEPRVRHHALGSDVAGDRVLFGAGYGAGDLLVPSVSDDGRWLVLHVMRGTSGPTEIHLARVAADDGFRTAVAGVDAQSFGAVLGERLVVTTDLDAPNKRVMAADLDAPELEHWSELVAERPDAALEAVVPAGGRLLLTYLEDARQHLWLYDADGRRLHEIEFETLGSAGASGRWDSTETFLTYSSFHVPPTIYRYDVERDEREVWERVEVPIDAENVTVEPTFATSKDGTRVPMFLAHRADMALDGQNPTLLTGYGGFNASLSPSFSPDAALWIQRGGVFAMACLRGGGEYGEEWHRAGMLANKQNVFDDFAAACEHLVALGFTSPEHLAVLGGSNGGLLVGALLTQRPDLVGAVVCTYPLLDMVRYHRFLVAAYWVPEYGSSEDPEQFRTLLAYSPYHHVEPGVAYPATFFITGDGDTRVAPLHARKMAALVQARTGGAAPVLLRYHTKAGHSGGQTVEQRIEETVDLMSFLERYVGRGGD